MKNPTPAALDLGTYHIHLATVDVDELFAIVTISSSFSGLWDFIQTIPRVSAQGADLEYNRVKRALRAEFKANTGNGLLVPVNGCSPKRVESSMIHLATNQGISLYDPSRDGYPNN